MKFEIFLVQMPLFEVLEKCHFVTIQDMSQTLSIQVLIEVDKWD